jgi:hypothetical protein
VIDQTELIVRDGDLVECTGGIIAAPGRPVYYCAPHPEPAIFYDPPRPPECPAGLSVPLTGVDLGLLAMPRTVAGVLAGSATIRGIWRDRTIAVTEQFGPVRSEDYQRPGGQPRYGPANALTPTMERISELAREDGTGIFAWAPWADGAVSIELLVVDQALYDRLVATGDSERFILRPAIVPVR